jgi:hypothetical protein
MGQIFFKTLYFYFDKKLVPPSSPAKIPVYRAGRIGNDRANATRSRYKTEDCPMNTSALKDDSTTGAMDAAQLAVLARKAHEQKRIKECLGLINQLLLCDPGNSEGQSLQAAVLSDMEQDLSDARVLLADSQERNDHKYRKAAEIILLKILYLDPTHAEAKTLLAAARAAEPAQATPVPAESPRPKPPMLEEFRFTAQPTATTAKAEPQGSTLAGKLPVLFIGLALLAGGGLFLYRPQAAMSALSPEVAVATPAPIRANREPVTELPKMTETDSPQAAQAAADPHAILAAAGPLSAMTPAAPVQAAATGFLAVNSPIAAEIYMGGKFVGETPTTLQLPAGVQTLEYRHGDLRTVMTHDIKPGGTVNALVGFDVTVQINARPWAQVFIDGGVRKPLGQTPLSSVRVPLGSVLAFENPNFPSKSHLVTEKDSSIQVVFP